MFQNKTPSFLFIVSSTCFLYINNHNYYHESFDSERDFKARDLLIVTQFLEMWAFPIQIIEKIKKVIQRAS